MENIEMYLGKVIPLEIASKVWAIISQMEGRKSIVYVDGGCIVNFE